jgi:hypothetical protein
MARQEAVTLHAELRVDPSGLCHAMNGVQHVEPTGDETFDNEPAPPQGQRFSSAQSAPTGTTRRIS